MLVARRILKVILAILVVLVAANTAWALPFAYIANVSSDNVSVIDTANNTVVATVAVGTSPRSVTVNFAGTRAYVANQGSNNVSIIDTSSNTVIGTVPVGSAPTGIAVNRNGTRAYVANSGASTVSIVDTGTNSVIASVPVGTNPTDVAINPAGTRAYVANLNSAILSTRNLSPAERVESLLLIAGQVLSTSNAPMPIA